MLEQHPTSIHPELLFPFPFWPGGEFPVPLCWGQLRRQGVNYNSSVIPEITMISEIVGELEASSIQTGAHSKERK